MLTMQASGNSFLALSNLPEVQRFYDEARNTKSIQVLTLCRDYDYTHASGVYEREEVYVSGDRRLGANQEATPQRRR